jgi:DNA-directed RNA polymerase sigma subunit (sigma70/sigma32)
VPTILGELKRHFGDKGSSIHLPRGLQEHVLKVQGAETQLGEQTQRSPTVVEIADHLTLDAEQVLEALDAIAAQRAASLDQTTSRCRPPCAGASLSRRAQAEGDRRPPRSATNAGATDTAPGHRRATRRNKPRAAIRQRTEHALA